MDPSSQVGAGSGCLTPLHTAISPAEERWVCCRTLRASIRDCGARWQGYNLTPCDPPSCHYLPPRTRLHRRRSGSWHSWQLRAPTQRLCRRTMRASPPRWSWLFALARCDCKGRSHRHHLLCGHLLASACTPCETGLCKQLLAPPTCAGQKILQKIPPFLNLYPPRPAPQTLIVTEVDCVEPLLVPLLRRDVLVAGARQVVLIGAAGAAAPPRRGAAADGRFERCTGKRRAHTSCARGHAPESRACWRRRLRRHRYLSSHAPHSALGFLWASILPTHPPCAPNPQASAPSNGAPPSACTSPRVPRRPPLGFRRASRRCSRSPTGPRLAPAWRVRCSRAGMHAQGGSCLPLYCFGGLCVAICRGYCRESCASLLVLSFCPAQASCWAWC